MYAYEFQVRFTTRLRLADEDVSAVNRTGCYVDFHPEGPFVIGGANDGGGLLAAHGVDDGARHGSDPLRRGLSTPAICGFFQRW